MFGRDKGNRDLIIVIEEECRERHPHHHTPKLDRINHRLDQIEGKLNRVLGLELSELKGQKKIMATQQDFTDILTAARGDLANIAADEAAQTAKIAELQASIDAGGMTAAEEDAAKAELQAFKDELAAAAAAIPDPETPPA